MNRSERRRMAKKPKKKVKNLTVTEFDGIIGKEVGTAFNAGHEAGFEWGVKIMLHALNKEFGFGEKRQTRLLEAIKDIEEE
ncbi:hypothetical protein EUAN_07130 [Andreesenia angusta]|uniref:Uncharacterized protein n=1 Tax=Andreesenia angusta TaxID=39480 RepID=A0A1S1VAS6_9FIRM|nr:hypothetical protein [Andreesenia angusta]OHW62929.1 hypothetical protein EUAN_07130 [Andreesenia angusta]